MDILNTRRLRVSVRLFNPGYGERFRWWRLGTYTSRDHGRPRQETNVYGAILGVQWEVKWRPAGRTGDLGCCHVGCTRPMPHEHTGAGPERVGHR